MLEYIILRSKESIEESWFEVLYAVVEGLEGFDEKMWAKAVKNSSVEMTRDLTINNMKCDCGESRVEFLLHEGEMSLSTDCQCGKIIRKYLRLFDKKKIKMKQVFTPKDCRILKRGQLVGVHWNSHKNCYSIVDMKTRNQTNLVLGYAQSLELEDVTFKFDRAKQKKVREQGTKDRHAFVVGKFVGFETTKNHEKLDGEFKYSPFKYDDFVLVTQGKNFVALHADGVIMDSYYDKKPWVKFDCNKNSYTVLNK